MHGETSTVPTYRPIRGRHFSNILARKSLIGPFKAPAISSNQSALSIFLGHAPLSAILADDVITNWGTTYKNRFFLSGPSKDRVRGKRMRVRGCHKLGYHIQKSVFPLRPQ